MKHNETFLKKVQNFTPFKTMVHGHILDFYKTNILLQQGVRI